MQEKDIKEIKLSIKPNRDTVSVDILSKNDLTTSFSVSPTTLTSMFGQSYNTGYMPVDGSGIVYSETRDNKKLIVLYRSLKTNQNITWMNTQIQATTPHTFFFWMLEPFNSNFKRVKERILLSTGSSLGGPTPLYTGRWMGNVYSSPDTSSTNICWGTTAVAPGGEVTLMSLLNIANDFYTHPFSTDLGGSLRNWEEFRDRGTFTRHSVGTMQQQIERMWSNERY